jgi:hypothetical protein
VTCSNETQGIQMTPFDVDVRRALRADCKTKMKILPGGTNEIFLVMIGLAPVVGVWGLYVRVGMLSEKTD